MNQMTTMMMNTKVMKVKMKINQRRKVKRNRKNYTFQVMRVMKNLLKQM